MIRTGPARYMLVICASLHACAPSNLSMGSEAGPLMERQEELVGALKARDAGAVGRMFMENGLLHVADMPPLEGREVIVRFYDRVFDYMEASAPTLERLQVSSESDLAYAAGSIRNTFRGEDGPMDYFGKYAIVWRRVGSEWMIALFSMSENQSAGVGAREWSSTAAAGGSLREE